LYPDRTNSLFFIHPGLSYLQSKWLTNQTTITTPPHHREGHKQMKKEQATLLSLRPRSPKVRRHSLDHWSSPHFAQTPSSSNSDFNSGKCNKAVTNADQDTQRTPLVATVSIRPSSRSATMDIESASEDGRRHRPAPSPEQVQLKSVGPPA
jgi:hypothetical protein